MVNNLPNTSAPPSKQTLIPGKITKTGIPRISKKPAMVIGGLLFIVAIVFISSDALKPKANAQSAHESPFAYYGQNKGEADILVNSPQVGMIGQPANLPQEDQLVNGPSSNNSVNTMPSQYEQMQYQLWQRQQQEALQEEHERQEQIDNAHESKTTVFSENETLNRQTINEQDSSGAVQSLSPLKARAQYQQSESNYLLSTRVQALSPNEIKAGTVIPATLIAGINSDFPGEIIAQVTSNVFDTASGERLLIPQGAKLFGKYEHHVVLGQKRVLVVWNRIIYPDASSLDLEGMAGYDESGYAGFKDKVNHHTWSVFNRALLMSAITAGAQLSQPRTRTGDYSYSSQQIMAASLGMNMNQLSMLTMQNRMNIVPTITIRPGYRFNVMVNKDIILPIWEEASNHDAEEFDTVSR